MEYAQSISRLSNKALLRAIHDSLEYLSLSFSNDDYNRWRDGIIEESEFYNNLLRGLNDYSDIKFLTPDGKPNGPWSKESGDMIKKWIRRTIIYRRAQMYYDNGLRSYRDVVELTSVIMDKAMIAIHDALEDEDLRVKLPVVGVVSRSIFDSEEMKANLHAQRSRDNADRANAMRQLEDTIIDRKKLIPNE